MIKKTRCKRVSKNLNAVLFTCLANLVYSYTFDFVLLILFICMSYVVCLFSIIAITYFFILLYTKIYKYEGEGYNMKNH